MKKKSFTEGMRAYIARLSKEGHYSSAKSYLDALNSFNRFCGLDEAGIKKRPLSHLIPAYKNYFI